MNHEPATDGIVDVFFVGVGKCGTSWIFEYLRRRGDVGVPKIKEPYILGEDSDKRARQIAKLFDGRRPRCDFSNVYYWEPENAREIELHNPAARVVFTVRRPSRRVASHFLFLQRLGYHPGQTLSSYLAGDDPDAIVDRSDYHEIIKPYADLFGPDRLLVLPLELLGEDAQMYANQLCEFLEIEPRQLTDQDRERVLEAAAARSPVVSRAAKELALFLRRIGLLSLLGRLKDSALIGRLLFVKRDSVPIRVDLDAHPRLNKMDLEYPEFLARFNRAAADRLGRVDR